MQYAYSGMLEEYVLWHVSRASGFLQLLHMHSFQVIIHAILATRMHLYLWHGDHPDRRYSDVFTSIRPPNQTPESYELP
jgi:hypothetical protein